MKKFFVFMFFISLCAFSFSQTCFTSSEYAVCVYNQSSGEYDICSYSEQQIMIKVPFDETSVSITTEKGTSVYYVMERYADTENKKYWYMVRFNNETEYVMVFDINDDEIRVTSSYEKESPVIHYFISSSWNEN